MTLLRKLIKKHREPLINKLLRRVDDYDIYTHFLEFEPEFYGSCNSPLRDDDTCPSFCIYVPDKIPNLRREEIWYKDQATGDYGNVFKFVKKFALHWYNIELTSFKEVVEFINEEMKLDIFNTTNVKFEKVRKKRVFAPKKATEIKFTARAFTKEDLNFWNQYHVITRDILNRFKVNSVGYLLNDNNTVKAKISRTNLCFAYICFDKIKLYQPHARREFKWRNTCLSHYYFGLEQLQKKDTLIITKSLKDIMCFVGLCDVDAIAPQSETQDMPIEFINKLKSIYKRIIVVMDFDPAGVAMANKLKEHFEIRFISTHRTLVGEKLKCVDKDLSDYLSIHGLEPARQLMLSWKLPLVA